MLTALILAAAGLTAIAAAGYLITRSGRVRHPHHPAGPLADRPWPLA